MTDTEFRPVRGLNCCGCENPFGNGMRTCCDCDGDDCREFREICRDCFWPFFSHPTWLCCRILYGCCRRRERC